MNQQSPPKPPTQNRTALLRWPAVWHIAYGAVLALVVWSLSTVGDRTWWGTMLLFSPRWIFGLPLLLLIPLGMRYHRRWLWCDAILLAVLLGPIMGLQVPADTQEPSADLPVLRVVTCNLRGRPFSLQLLLETSAADVFTLQECPPNAFDALPEELRTGWHVQQEDKLCIASRFPLSNRRHLGRERFGGWGTIGLGCQVETPGGLFDCVTLHLSTPREGLEAVLYSGRGGISRMQDNIALRERESQFVREWIRSEFDPEIVTGDFNMPVKSRIYQDTWSDGTNAFSQAGLGFGFTKYTNWHGVRIDHILVSGAWRVEGAGVLDDVGSDHRPLAANLMRRLH